ncbi:MAG: UDP-N-acetylglucosamine 1-carboxyvinyltransferase [Bdellovibrionaceae bacterium]|nr:UDP-N-acetylglucosamine 1-carboxyvinyltransferase [Pseudobdellovibrionaceae bacterium]
MDKMVVKKSPPLKGEVAAGGSKNSALPILFSTLLAEGEHSFGNVPRLMDIDSTALLLNSLGAKLERRGDRVFVQVGKADSLEAHYDIVRKMRASILCLGPLLARYGEATVSLPGGCAIGTRPINLHLEGLKEMGAEIRTEKGYVIGKCKRLKGATILFDSPTVGGTENIMMAAALADGTTVIENAAKEPEIVDLANYINAMGGKVSGAGSSILKIEGVEKLKAAEHEVIPDRIEAGTLLMAGAITGGEVLVKNCVVDHIEALLLKLEESGFRVTRDGTQVSIHSPSGWQGVDVTTAPFPAFATDLQAQFMALMTQAEGTSVITESVFENRFMHVQELVRLGADITPKTRVAVVRGTPGKLQGAPVMATDLRASACLVLIGLVAQGETTVSRIYHLDRGYENLESKLSSLGAKIERTK